MFESIIRASIKYKFLVFMMVVGIIGAGIYAMLAIPLDAVPDITNNQVQVVTVSPTLAPQEVEQLITFPIEVAVANIPDVTEIRSISRYGLSVITIVFADGMPILDARQYVKEQLALAEAEIPAGLGAPELMPITTGLGEIYQYTIDVLPEYRVQYDPMQLRTIQDWIVKRQLSGIPGIIEVSSFGGYLKQYEVSIDPVLLRSFGLTIKDVFMALEANNQNSGGSYIEKSQKAYYIRTEGRISELDDIRRIVVGSTAKAPILVKDIATVGWGSPKRYGAMTKDGLGEAVGGITLMLKGANSSDAIRNVQDRVAFIQKNLPEGVIIAPYLDRSNLVMKAIKTVATNLIEGGIIVMVILFVFLGHWRASVIVASVIPLALFFAFIMMRIFNVSANLMSLGALDFGIVVDGAVIIVESVIHTLYLGFVGQKLSQHQMDEIVANASANIYKTAAFGVLIILIVFFPILTLTGIEGKMFTPMALTVSFAILGAMLLSLTYVPVISTVLLKKNIKAHFTFSDHLMVSIRKMYLPVLDLALRFPKMVLSVSIALLVISGILFTRMGSEFIPTLEEGDLAMQMTIQPGSSLNESVATSTKAEQILLANFPEVKHVVSKIGTAEVPTDPMAIEDADIMIILKDKDEWTTTDSREELVEMMKEKLDVLPGASFEFTQPIQLRFNELMTGAKTDIAIKVFGEDVDELKNAAIAIENAIIDIPGAGDVKIEQTDGLPQLIVSINRHRLAQYGLHVDEVNQAIRAAYAGEVAGVVFEGEKKFDLVVRLSGNSRSDLNLSQMYLPLSDGSLIPLSELTTTQLVEGPMQISREDAKRRIVIGVNVRNRDVASLVADIQQTIANQVKLPPGYFVTYGGEFENLRAARERLMVAVPISLLLIFIFLFTAFKSVKYSLIIFTAVPFAAIGGVFALFTRGMPFSISAGVGFIALFGVAVLNGIVLISYLNDLRKTSDKSLPGIIVEGCTTRLRPVLMTASVAAFGFLPMALSSSAGAEVQKPLATVVIGGLVSSTLLTLLVLPAIYLMFNNFKTEEGNRISKLALTLLFALGIPFIGHSQEQPLSLQTAVQRAIDTNPQVAIAQKNIEIATINKEQSWQPGRLNVDYQRGNINSFASDYYWDFMQSLGNPFAAAAKRDLSTSMIHAEEAQLQLVIKEVVYQTSTDWLQWANYQQQLDLLLPLQPLLDSLKKGVELGVNNGAINKLEAQSVAQLHANVVNQQMTLRMAIDQLGLSLQQTCQLDGLPQKADSTGWAAFMPKQTPTGISQAFLVARDQRLAFAEQQIKFSQQSMMPDFRVGYFQQQIDLTKGYNGWRAGISIPLWWKPEKKEVQKAKVELDKTTLAQNFEISKMETQLAMLIDLEEEFRQRLSNDTQLEMPSVDQILKSVSIGQTRLVEATQLVRQHIEVEMSRLANQLNYQLIINDIKYLTE